ncbi:MAG TPA: helix-turn-helix transcriptional regulator [Sphingobacteriaceae bacterium]
MAADGKPDLAAIRCGQEIERLRLSRNWTRAKLLVQVWDELEPDDPNYDTLTEAWLARLETGRMVKIPRQTIEALCRALWCTDRERTRLLLYADRNVVSISYNNPSPVAEMLNHSLAVIYNEAEEILATLMGQRRAGELDETEMLELTVMALDMVLKRRCT